MSPSLFSKKPVKPPQYITIVSGVDWSRSQVYAIGLNSLYLNLKEREGQGSVTPDEIEFLRHKLPGKLWGGHFVAIGSMLAILISAVAMYIQLSFPRFESAIRSVVRGISVLSIIYAFLGCLSIMIVIFRNI